MVRIVEEKCIGCGVCAAVCPEGFEIVSGKSKIKNKNADCIEKAAQSCPMRAIVINNEKIDIYGRQRGFGQGKGFGRRRRGGRSMGRWNREW